MPSARRPRPPPGRCRDARAVQDRRGLLDAEAAQVSSSISRNVADRVHVEAVLLAEPRHDDALRGHFAQRVDDGAALLAGDLAVPR